jgi:D-inositol-3-phosphate glycosyltransferase
VRKAFVAADLLLLPSTEEETFSLVAVEAAFTGVPCLRSNTGGATEQIVEDVTGVSFPVGDKGEFHRKLEKLAQDPIQLSRMGIAAQAHAAKRFDMRSRVKDYVALYEQAVESRQSRKRPTHPTLKPL